MQSADWKLSKQTPFTTAVDWDNWGITQSDNIEHIDLLKTTQASFYDEKWYEEWKKSFNEWQQNSDNSAQTTAYSLINLHEMLARTTVATPVIRNPKPTSFDDLLGTTEATILDLGITTPSLTSSIDLLKTTGIPIFKTTSIQLLDFTTPSPTSEIPLKATTALDEIILAELHTTNMPDIELQSTTELIEEIVSTTGSKPEVDEKDEKALEKMTKNGLNWRNGNIFELQYSLRCLGSIASDWKSN
jgi:hypothetical protein